LSENATKKSQAKQRQKKIKLPKKNSARKKKTNSTKNSKKNLISKKNQLQKIKKNSKSWQKKALFLIFDVFNKY